MLPLVQQQEDLSLMTDQISSVLAGIVLIEMLSFSLPVCVCLCFSMIAFTTDANRT